MNLKPELPANLKQDFVYTVGTAAGRAIALLCRGPAHHVYRRRSPYDILRGDPGR